MGYTTTSDFSGLLTPAVTREIVLVKAMDDAPLYGMLLAQNRVLPTPNPEVKWHDRGMWTRRTAINNGAGYDTSATDLVVDDASICAKYDVIINEDTGEVMLVTAVDTGTDTLTVVRSIGATAAAAITDNDDLTIIGNAFPETQDTPDQKRSSLTEYKNYSQIFRKSVKFSGTAEAAGKLIEDGRMAERKVQFDEILRDIEYAMLFGEKANRTQDGNPQRFMDGIIPFANQIVTDQSGTMTYEEHETFLEEVFEYGSKDKVAFCGGVVATALTQIYQGLGQVQYSVQNEALGITYNRIVSNHGTLAIVRHPHLTGAVYGGHEVVVDMNAVKLRPLKGDKDRSLALREDVQTKKTDGVMDEWLGEMTAEWGSPWHHGVNYGITGAA